MYEGGTKAAIRAAAADELFAKMEGRAERITGGEQALVGKASPLQMASREAR